MRRFHFYALLIWPLLLMAAFPRQVAAVQTGLEAGANLTLAWPQGDFKDQVDFAWGGGGRLGYGIKRDAAFGPSIFLNLDYLNYGRERRLEPFSTTIPDVTVEVVTTNYMVLVCPGICIGSRRGRTRPYGELYGGLNYIATSTSIKNAGLGGEQIASSTNLSDWTYQVGFGGGVMVLLWTGEPAGQDVELSELLLDVKLSYSKGGEADYLKKGSIRREGGSVQYETIKSGTDLLQLKIGLGFRF